MSGTDRRIPLLREVYQQFPDMPINVDVKTNSDELIKKVRYFVTSSPVLVFVFFYGAFIVAHTDFTSN